MRKQVEMLKYHSHFLTVHINVRLRIHQIFPRKNDTSATVIYTKKREENKSTIRVAAILGSEKISFWEEVRKGLRQAAKEQGILLTEYTPEDEANFPDLIESAYYMDVNAIAICIYESDMWEECEPI